MSEKNFMAAFLEWLGDAVLDFKVPHPRRVFILVKYGYHKDAISWLLKKFPLTIISTITGVDLSDMIELNYHLWCGVAEVTVRTRLPKTKPIIESITDLIPGAALYEREVFDLFGVVFLGHPDLKRLLLPESWPQDQYPLRKDWRMNNQAPILEVKPIEAELSRDKSTVNVVLGPQHPALHEPERFLFKVDGEIVVDVEPRLGYAHRGIEKAAERLMFFQDVHLVERVCGICNVAHTTCFCQAVELLGDIDVPPRAKYLRVIIHELNRIHSHLLLLGVAGLEIGFETLFQYIWRDREIILDLMEKATGNRVMAEFSTIGGVRRDLTSTLADEIERKLNSIKKRIKFYRKVFKNDPIINLRTRGVGVLKESDALKLSVVGPVARGSNVKVDVRKHDPYAAYDEIPFEEITYDDCDSWARFMVRLDELEESIDIITYAVNHLPSGPYRVRVPRKIPEGESVSRVEAPRGELIHYVKSNGTAYPERVKIRSPTLGNIISMKAMIKGCYIADIPTVMASLDPCFSCTDRMVFVDVRSGDRWVWSINDIKARMGSGSEH